MAKAIVLGGSGQVGGMAVESLLVTKDFDQVLIGDTDIQRATQKVRKINSPKLSATQVDATDPVSIKKAIQGCDMVINCVGPFYRTQRPIVKTVIECGINYVDVSDDVSVMDDILALNDQAKAAGITAVIGLGFSPGITNILARYAVEYLLDETDAIDIYHAHGGEPEEGPGVIGHRFHCMSVDCPMFLDGELKTVKFFEADGIALREKIGFLGIGENIQVYPYPHPEQVTLPKYFKLKQVTNKGTVLPAEYYNLIMDVCKIGLTSTDALTVKGQDVVPYDFAISFIMRERDRILKRVGFGEQVGSSTISVKGKQNGYPLQYLFKLALSGGKQSGVGVSTGIPAATGAIMLQRGQISQKGVMPPEACVNPKEFFPLWLNITKLATGKEMPFENVLERIDHTGKLTKTDLFSKFA